MMVYYILLYCAVYIIIIIIKRNNKSNVAISAIISIMPPGEISLQQEESQI